MNVGDQKARRNRRELRLTQLLLLLTLTAGVLFVVDAGRTVGGRIREGRYLLGSEHFLFLLVALFLIYGNVMYQLARIGYLKRPARHTPAPPADVDAFAHAGRVPPVSILIPSYKEDVRTIRQTLLAAALQEYPARHVVLLIDDPPSPHDPRDAATLTATRKLVGDVHRLLRTEAYRTGAALAGFLKRQRNGRLDPRAETAQLIALYTATIDWLLRQAAEHPILDHNDALFVQQTFLTLADSYREQRREWSAVLAGAAAPLSAADLWRAYRRAAALFQVEVTSFERKRYVNLGHAPNKAANLNAYIGLVGKRFREIRRADGLHLEPTAAAWGGLAVPDAAYIVTIDADSVIVPTYVPRLVHFLEQPAHARIAVTQTPYSAVPGAAAAIERIAGATTDIQYLIHQGFTHYQATFWVGANAVIRKAALDDIGVVARERGFAVPQYIRDRTVIEDTESTIDLIARGWQLHNYPARLAYSATPADFGALLIQRRRWANGGLIVLPKLLAYLFARPRHRRKLGEGFMRLHYLTSISGVSVGLLLLLVVPFRDSAFPLWLALAALPYYYLYARDLTRLGYRPSDLLRVYAFNLMLLPINLGGVLKSLQQAWTGRQIPFGRTPKVRGRTAAPRVYLVAQVALLGYSGFTFLTDLVSGQLQHAVFSLANAAFFAYVMTRFIGWQESKADLFGPMSRRLWGSRG
ncbi:MAG: glycosyltransferase family 2 protein [Chloroflexota bacterium]|nr:glycosyltransferase family 2 protein [Chloroflexota bacterium]